MRNGVQLITYAVLGGISIGGAIMVFFVLPETKQLNALSHFIKDMQAKYQIPKTRVYTHRQFVNTQCPGKKLGAWLTKFLSEQA